MSDVKLGQIIEGNPGKDAIHLAVSPVVAGNEVLLPGEHVGINAGGTASSAVPPIGIVDPFLSRKVRKGEKFWLCLYQNTVTGMRHEWEHPAFKAQEKSADDTIKSASYEWMRNWAWEHMRAYGGDSDSINREQSYQDAVSAGHDLNVGPHESARDFIDYEWWKHWENITGCAGKSGEYFSCGC